MSDPPATRLAPVPESQRIQALDVLRGFAVLGILVMNIQSFSMIEAAYFNPAASGYFTSALDRWIWIGSHLLTDQKFLTLFSVLFGAGIVLMTGRAEAAGRRVGALHYRRTFWLLVIGAAHAYLLWFGDVLVWYALCGALIFPLRKRRPRTLLVLGMLGIAIGSLIYHLSALTLPSWPKEMIEHALEPGWRPSEEHVAAELAAYRDGGWRDQMALRVPASLIMHSGVFLSFALWRAGGLMLAGMALFKWGVLSAERSASFYRRLALIGLGLGWPLVASGIHRNMEAGWRLEYSRFIGIQYNHWGSVLVAAGYLAVVMLWCQGERLVALRRRLAAVGRMALTNYLTQTIRCTLVFYGHGLGWYQRTPRIGQLAVLLAVWVLQLAWSPWWLHHFRFGPCEWLWRSRTYLEIQPFRRSRRPARATG